MNLQKYVFVRAVRIGARALDQARTPLSRVGNCTVAMIIVPPGCGGGTLFQEQANLNDWCTARLANDPTNNPRLLAERLHLGVVGHEAPAWGIEALIKPVVAELKYRGHVPFLIGNGDAIANAPKLIAFIVDIGNQAGSPIIFQTAGDLAKEITSPRTSVIQSVRSRVNVEAKLPRPDISDALLLADELLDQVKFEADLTQHIFNKCGKSVSIRSLLFEFYRIEQLALTAGLSCIGLARWCALTDEEPAEPKKLSGPQSAGVVQRLPVARQAVGQ